MAYHGASLSVAVLLSEHKPSVQQPRIKNFKYVYVCGFSISIVLSCLIVLPTIKTFAYFL